MASVPQSNKSDDKRTRDQTRSGDDVIVLFDSAQDYALEGDLARDALAKLINERNTHIATLEKRIEALAAANQAVASLVMAACQERDAATLRAATLERELAALHAKRDAIMAILSSNNH